MGFLKGKQHNRQEQIPNYDQIYHTIGKAERGEMTKAMNVPGPG